MDNDDVPVGRVLSRREALTLLGAAGAGLLVGGAPPARVAAQPPLTCVARPEMIEGPYFVDARLDRSDIRTEPTTGAARPGAPLTLTFNVADVTGGRCAPLAGALVDVWQCDALGAYSGFDDDRQGFRTKGETWLRGQQVTDARGVARFTTIYPGWYGGRAVHIHFKVRAPAAGGAGTYEFTSQLYFDEALTRRVYARAPYASRGRPDTSNARDAFYRNRGDRLLLAVAEAREGYAANFSLGLDLADASIGRADGRRGPAGRRPG